jgi:hypothetical protein
MDLTSIAIVKRIATANSASACSSLHEYLHAGLTLDFQILEFWKVHERFMPGLAQKAQDILTIHVTRVGVERIFPIARQICTFQRNHLDAHTIMQLMIVRSHDRLMAVDKPENKCYTGRLKKKMGFSRVDNMIAKVQQIQEENQNSHASEQSSQIIVPSAMGCGK